MKNWGTILAGLAALITALLGVYSYISPSQENIDGEKVQEEVESQEELIDVKFILQNNENEPVGGAQVHFIFEGAPLERETDDNGYVRVSIPIRKDIDIIARKDNYKTLRLTLNLDADPNRTIIYKLDKEPLEIDPTEESSAEKLNSTLDQTNTLYAEPVIQTSQLYDEQCVTINSLGQLAEIALKGESLIVHDFPRNVFIGRRQYEEIAFMANWTSMGGSEDRIPYKSVYIWSSQDNFAEISCALRANYASLNLAVGLDDTLSKDGKFLGMKIFVDGTLVNQTEVYRGELKNIAIPLNSSKNVSLWVNCMSENQFDRKCPPLSIVQATLQ